MTLEAGVAREPLVIQTGGDYYAAYCRIAALGFGT